MQRPTILLATFNGERFLRQLVDSIDGQTFAEWQVLARDDGSEDETGDLLERWAKRDSRVTVIRDGKRQSPSAASNFAALLDEAVNSDGDLFFFCDQDDIWEPEKIEVCLSAIENHNASAPLLLVSNLKLIDAQDSRDLGTFWDSNMMPPLEKRTTAELCSRNLYPGCSMAFNRNLLELAAGVPSGVIMHDWWLAILAQASSRIIEVPRPLVRYRQHSNNTTGATKWWRELTDLVQGKGRQNLLFCQSFDQAEAAANRLVVRGHNAAADAVNEFCTLARLPRGAALRRMWTLGIRTYHPALFLTFAFRLVLLHRRLRSSAPTS